MDIPCDVCLEPHELYTWYQEKIHKMKGCPTCKGVRPRVLTPDELEKCIAIGMALELLGDDLDGVASMVQDYLFLM